MNKIPIKLIRSFLIQSDNYNQLIYDKMHLSKCTNCDKELKELLHQQDYIQNTLKDLIDSILEGEWEKEGVCYLMYKHHVDENYREYGLCDGKQLKGLIEEGWKELSPVEDMEYE